MTVQQKQDSKRLRTLADWFDTYDAKNGNIGMDEVQRSLRAIADRIERLESGMANWVRVANERQSELNRVEAEMEQLRRDKINIYEQINSHSREVIESGGLRFNGVHMIHISEAFQSHGVDTGLPF